MYINNINNVNEIKKPKRKTLKIVLLSALILILGFGVWIGVTAFSALKKITAFSDNSGSIFSFLKEGNPSNIKGASEGRTNILLLGHGGSNHPGGNLSDTIIVMSLNWKTKKVAMISVPRDLWVPIENYGSAKINEAFSYGEQNSKITGGGGAASSQTVSKVLGIPIHYFITVDFTGFKNLVDTVGGVDIYVEKDLYDPSYPAPNMIDYDPFKISKGQHHMNGELALKYVRSRKTTSDFDRSKRQEQVISELKNKLISLNVLANPKKISNILDILGNHLKTNMSIEEIKGFWDSINEFDTKNIINEVLDTAADGPLTAANDARGYIIIPKKGVNNFTDLQKIAKEIFSQSAIDLDEVNIEVLNGTSKAGLAKKIADELEADGYNVINVDDSQTKYEVTTIYNCSGDDLDEILQDLEKELSGILKDKTSCGNIDIQVIVGQDNI